MLAHIALGDGLGQIEVKRFAWAMLGLTFYEEVKPLVWEGECLSMDSRTGFLVFTEAAFLPPGYERRKFRVVATEIVEGEDAARAWMLQVAEAVNAEA